MTGASGFVGGAVARAAVAAGHVVVTSSRRAAQVPGARHVRWDLDVDELPERTRERVGDVDVVVHAAAFVGEGGRAAAVRRTSVGGTRAVLRAFPGARFVHISSASVYDPFRPSVRSREDEAPVGRYLNAYAAAKAEAEAAVLGEQPSRDRGVVVLRPHAVYGPGDTTLLPRVLGAVRRGVLPLPGGGRCLQSLTSISTLTEAVLAASRPGLPSPLVVNVADAEPVVLRTALLELLERRGLVDVRILDVPWRLAWHLGHLGEVATRGATAGAGTARLSRYAVSHLAMERTLDLSVLRDVLGVHPGPTSLVGAQSW